MSSSGFGTQYPLVPRSDWRVQLVGVKRTTVDGRTIDGRTVDHQIDGAREDTSECTLVIKAVLGTLIVKASRRNNVVMQREYGNVEFEGPNETIWGGERIVFDSPDEIAVLDNKFRTFDCVELCTESDNRDLTVYLILKKVDASPGGADNRFKRVGIARLWWAYCPRDGIESEIEIV